MSQLALQHVSKSFHTAEQTITLLKSASYVFHSGRSYAISGASGSGKSTLLHILAGIEAPTTGHVMLDQQPITSAALQTHIGLVFQTPNLILALNVWENVALKGLILGANLATARARAHDLLAQVGLAQRATALVPQLSGGEQQRVALARALYAPPQFLLADEPTGNLDLITGQKIITLLLNLQQQQQLGLIICTHDPQLFRSCDEQLQLSAGQLR